jgi:NAD(P)-dependent dehydrogenase (short-subunit alcohol dehydrogenase family)
MALPKSPVWLITQCSGHLGAALVRRVLDKRHKAIVTDPDVSRMFPSLELPRRDAIALNLDTTQALQINNVVNVACREFGGIDALVINALPLTGDDDDDDDDGVSNVRACFEANVLGAWSLAQAVIAIMRRQGSGHIFITSSLVDVQRTSRSTSQSMTKHALEGWSTRLATELEPVGISVTYVETEPFPDISSASRAADFIATMAGKRRAPRHIVLGQAAFDAVLEEMSARLLEIATHRGLSASAS